MRPKLVLKNEDTLITVSGIKAVIGPTETDNTISSNELVCDPLKPTNSLLGLKRLLGL